MKKTHDVYMDRVKSEKQLCSVVLKGDFNPKIFQPAWFAMNNLIRPSEVDDPKDTKIRIIHPSVADFGLAWCNVLVTRDTFSVMSIQEIAFEPIRDLVIGTFQVLHHTPITKVGINHDRHYKFKAGNSADKFFSKNIDINLWKKLLPAPKVNALIIKYDRQDNYKGAINIKIEPSDKIKDGIFIAINDHFEITSDENKIGCKEVVSLLKNVWSVSDTRAGDIMKKLLEY